MSRTFGSMQRNNYSSDGITWTGTTGTSATIFSNGYGVAGNPRIGATVVDSQIVLNANGYNQSSRLDVVSDSYYNFGFSNFSSTIRSKELY